MQSRFAAGGWPVLAGWCVLVVGSAVSAVSAQTFHPALGDVYLSTSATAEPEDCTTRIVHVDPFAIFTFYLMFDIDWANAGLPERDTTDGARAFEAGVGIPAGAIVVSRGCWPPACGEWWKEPSANDDWIVGFGNTCATGAATPQYVIRYSALFIQPADDLRFTVGPVANSTFGRPGGPGPAPGWLACQGPNELYPCVSNTLLGGSLFVNPARDLCGLAPATTSWSVVKATYATGN